MTVNELAEKFGVPNRQNQLIEEMAELTQAICKMNRYLDHDSSLAKNITFLDLQNIYFVL